MASVPSWPGLWPLTLLDTGHWWTLVTINIFVPWNVRGKMKNKSRLEYWKILFCQTFLQVINHIKSETHQEDAKDAVDEDYAWCASSLCHGWEDDEAGEGLADPGQQVWDPLFDDMHRLEQIYGLRRTLPCWSSPRGGSPWGWPCVVWVAGLCTEQKIQHLKWTAF